MLQIGTAPTVVDVAGDAETYTALAVAAAVLVVYLGRLLRASRPQRRALLAVATTSLLSHVERLGEAPGGLSSSRRSRRATPRGLP